MTLGIMSLRIVRCRYYLYFPLSLQHVFNMIDVFVLKYRSGTSYEIESYILGCI